MLPAILIVLAAAALCAALIVALRPLLVRYALARPNARSSHREPTPQGGGIAVVAGTIVVAALSLIILPLASISALDLSAMIAAAVLISIVGAIDDIRSLEIVPRLLFQIIAVAIVIATLPHEARVVPFAPWWLDRLLLLVGGVWFVNLVNFMDGVDWMTVAEIVPVTAGLAAIGMMGGLPPYAVVVALALLGGMLGFAPFNRPVARLFLGDVGSLPVGLIVGWLLLLLASGGNLAAAILLPLYYLADATITLFRRLANGEKVWEAHRGHFYQRAADRGIPVLRISANVFAANLALAALAAISATFDAMTVKLVAFAAGAALVGLLLWYFERGRA